MTDADRSKRLAEWMGWLCRQNPYGANGEVWLFLEDPKGKTQYRLAPIYKLKDWNPLEHIEHAMMLEEEVERKGLQAAYASHLDNIVLNGAMISHRNIFKLIHATAAQRCAAVEKLMERGEKMKVTKTGWIGKDIDIKDTLVYNGDFLELHHVFPRKDEPINWGPLWPPRKVKITVEEVEK